MATLKQRLHRKNSSGTYDTIHYETSSDVVMRPSGRTVEQDLGAYLPEVRNNDNVPQSLKASKLIVGLTKGFLRGKALSVEGHTHDDRYYTESEVNSLLSGKAPSSHNHSASQITSGTLPIARGGTGATSASAARSALGAAAASHTHDDRYYTEAEVNSKIQGVENMIQITMGGVKLVGSGTINKSIKAQFSGQTETWQVGISGLPDGDFMRIVTVPFSGTIGGTVTSGGFCEYAIVKNSSDIYATRLFTAATGGAVNNYGTGYVWYKTDNSIMLKVGASNNSYTWYAFFLYEIYKYQS